jgi:cell division protein FtsZ
MVKEGLINLDFADVRSVMREMGKAMMGTGEASGERRAREAAEAAIANPLLDETSMKGAKGLLISITGGKDLTLFEVDEAATRIREEVDPDANIILGATFEEELEGIVRVSVVATGIESAGQAAAAPSLEAKAAEQLSQRLRGAIPRPATQPQQQAQHQPHPAIQQAAMQQPIAQQPIAQQPMHQTGQQAIQTPVHTRPATVPAQPMARPAAAPPQAPAASFDHPDMDFDLGDIGQHQPIDEGEAEEPFIPPVAEAPTRIPRVEDFPPVVQRQIEARQQPAHEDRGPIGLLRRLAS